jgi:hypothetical protein
LGVGLDVVHEAFGREALELGQDASRVAKLGGRAGERDDDRGMAGERRVHSLEMSA